MFRRLFFPLRLCVAVAGLVAGLALTAAQGAEAPRPVVVELYTSQGCSSCPQADALLARLAQRPGVLALSLPVTYWDMLGWKDTLASKANTNRQKGYAAAMGRGGIYTPQVIVDGVNDVVGSKQAVIEKDIAAREAALPSVPVALTVTRTEVDVSVGPANGKVQDAATIWLFRVHPEATVKITAGENAGRTVRYHNIVQVVKAIGMWKGKPVSLALPRESVGGGLEDGVAVVVQQDGYGRILGASTIETMRSPDSLR